MTMADDGSKHPPAGIGPSVRALRRQRGVTLMDLAEAVMLDKGYLSRIERNIKVPSIATVLKIAGFFDVPVAELFGETLGKDIVHVSRAGERTGHSPTSPAEYRIEELTSGKGAAGLDGFVMFPPEDFPEGRWAQHQGEELLYVIAGSVEVRFADRTIALQSGDSIQFPGALTHQVRRTSAETRVLIAISRV
jgi:transcriptional regulator with XRE-family HTH domain